MAKKIIAWGLAGGEQRQFKWSQIMLKICDALLPLINKEYDFYMHLNLSYFKL